MLPVKIQAVLFALINPRFNPTLYSLNYSLEIPNQDRKTFVGLPVVIKFHEQLSSMKYLHEWSQHNMTRLLNGGWHVHLWIIQSMGPTQWEYGPRPGHMATETIWCGQFRIFNSWREEKNKFG